MLNIALTGGIGSGKTLVSKVFHLLGVPIYYSDIEAKLLYKNPVIRTQVIDLLGKDSYQGSQLNTSYVSNLIFNKKDLLQQLNRIIHPAVRRHYDSWVIAQKCPIVMQESALVFETQQHERFDKVILITAPFQIRLERAMKRDNVSEEKIKSRMKNQFSEEKKKALANYIIVNDGETKLIPQIISLYLQLQSLNTSKD